jgi:transposase
MLATLLFPAVAHLRVDVAVRLADQIVVLARRAGRVARCPHCRHRSRQIHSHYERRLGDLPCCGSPVTIRLRVRRFVCDVPRCPRRIFSEQLPTLAAVRARRTRRAHDRLRAYGLAQGGQPGARQAHQDGLPVSRRTLLRLVRAAPCPAVGPIRVLGVDDFSLRKGRTYATILLDLETHRPIDILPDRTAQTFAAWLATHPEIEVISRDRAGAYADGARQGAPDAQQVADRFHILKNLSEAVQRFLSRKHARLKVAAQHLSQERQGEALPPAAEDHDAGGRRPTRARQEHLVSRARRVARYEEVCALQQAGLSARDIARRLGLNRSTVAGYLHAEGFPERVPRAPRPGLLTPYEPYLQDRWAAGCHNARVLYEEIRAQGFRGAAALVRRFLARWRTQPGRPGPTPRGVPPPSPAVPSPPSIPAKSPRQVTWLLLRPAAEVDHDDQAFLLHLGQICPEALVVQTLAQQFHTLVMPHDLPGLDPWITAVEQHGIPELLGFVAGIQRDRTAVDAAFISPWSQGQTEGQVNKIKLLERSMFGRAKLDLLRQRVLAAG